MRCEVDAVPCRNCGRGIYKSPIGWLHVSWTDCADPEPAKHDHTGAIAAARLAISDARLLLESALILLERTKSEEN